MHKKRSDLTFPQEFGLIHNPHTFVGKLIKKRVSRKLKRKESIIQ